MIRPCSESDVNDILHVINDAAHIYRDAIPDDCWHEPYMSMNQLRAELDARVAFHGYCRAGRPVGVMGLQNVGDVSLIRHAYVLQGEQRKGIGSQLLRHLLLLADRPVLMGTWRAASWAIHFYQKHGFRLVDDQTKNRLLSEYWSIPPRQIETSVVLADDTWWQAHHPPLRLSAGR